MIGPFFTISLDFELFWGVKDKRTIASYGANILGVRQAIPMMLKLFRQHQVRVTWATVGLLLCRNKTELLDLVPTIRPAYKSILLDPYATLDEVGDDEHSDPYHFAYSLVRQIQETDGMEIGSHTLGHFNCLEAGATPEAFRADMAMARHAFSRLDIKPISLVFPRNQYDAASLRVAYEAGIRVFRGNPAHPFYSPVAQSEENMAKRLGRLLDSYVNVAGHLPATPCVEGSVLNIPASQFLRPYSRRLAYLDGLRLSRICDSMSGAAKTGQGFHLWWHPHNFGINLAENMDVLQQIIRHYVTLRERYNMRSMTMADWYTTAEQGRLSGTSKNHAN